MALYIHTIASKTLTTNIEQTAEFQKIQQLAEAEKARLKKNQTPRNHAPTIDTKTLINLAGVTFSVHSQDKRKLVLIVDKNVDKISRTRALTMICATYDNINIEGWHFRPTSHRNRKLFLKPSGKAE